MNDFSVLSDMAKVFRCSRDAFEIHLKLNCLKHHEDCLSEYTSSFGKNIPDNLRMLYKRHKKSVKELRSEIAYMRKCLKENWESFEYTPEPLMKLKYENTKAQVAEVLQK